MNQLWFLANEVPLHLFRLIKSFNIVDDDWNKRSLATLQNDTPSVTDGVICHGLLNHYGEWQLDPSTILSRGYGETLSKDISSIEHVEPAAPNAGCRSR